MFKKFWSVLLIIALLVCNTATIAFAEAVADYSAQNSTESSALSESDIINSGKCGKNLSWFMYSDGTLEISGTGFMYEYTFWDTPPWHEYKDQLKKLILNEGMRNIADFAFSECTALSGELLIPESVEAIGQRAFCLCRGLEGELIIPQTVKEIEEQAFADCSGFTGDLIIPGGMTSIGYAAFDGCSGLNGKLVIPEGVAVINGFAFSGCSSLNGELVIPESVTGIGRNAFYGCSGFTGDFTIPEKVTTIGELAFFGTAVTLIIPYEAKNAEYLINFAEAENLKYEVVGMPVADFAGGDGSAENPYKVSTKEHLNNVRKYLDANFLMINDISFSEEDFEEGGAFYNNGKGWLPIGESDLNNFSGVFDGNGYAVSGLKLIASGEGYPIGFFGYVTGDIKNFGIESGLVEIKNSSISSVGALVGLVNGGTVDNCYSKADIIATNGSNYIGGIVGTCRQGTILNCKNYGIITSGKNTVGGIVGETASLVNNCSNYGTITNECDTGGIAGTASETIENCLNYGDVTAVNEKTGVARAGGIVCYQIGNGNIVNCHNEGMVKGADKAGGIVAVALGNVSKSSNSGDITLIKGGIMGDMNCVGGIVGRLGGNVEKSYNTGDICTRNEDSIGGHAGGIAGLADDTVDGNIIECYNMGDVNSAGHAGGIVGYLNLTLGRTSNCFNTGMVTGKINAGGIAASVSESGIQSCYNIAEVVILRDGTAGKGFAISMEGALANLENNYYLEGTGRDETGANALTNAQVKNKECFTDFDFDNVWSIDTDGCYTLPYLKGVKRPETIDINLQTISGIEDVTYTGEAIMHNIVVKNGATVLVEDTDYTVSYENNIEVGIATVKITGVGNYTGVITLTFEILDAGVTGDVNGDGVISTVDASIVISYYYGNVDFDETQMRLADVNGDGVISTIDASMIISYYYGKIDGFVG